jgi:hypothetical protein
MKTIESVKFYTLSIRGAYEASLKNQKALVVLAKGDEGTSIVLQARWPNRISRFARVGYCRFGRPPVWVVVDYEFSVAPYLKTPAGVTLDEAAVRLLVEDVVEAANNVAKARSAA